MVSQLSTAEIDEHLAALRQLEIDYEAYVHNSIFGHPNNTAALRKRLLLQTSQGQRALDASGIKFAMTPAPMFGGRILMSLPEQLFAFEQPVYEGPQGPDLVPHGARLVLDAISTAEGRLEDMRRNPAARRATAPRRARQPAEPRPRYTLFGRIKAVPAAVGFIADLGTAAVFIAGALKLLGVY
jgi:hypothetical protein